jgi:hypothetical protein
MYNRVTVPSGDAERVMCEAVKLKISFNGDTKIWRCQKHGLSAKESHRQ